MNYAEILTPLVTALVGYLMYLLQTWLKANIAPKQYAALAGLANTAVDAVEQLDRVSKLSSEQKYDLASETLTKSAKRLGVKLSEVEVNAFVHAAVKDLKDYQAS